MGEWTGIVIALATAASAILIAVEQLRQERKRMPTLVVDFLDSRPDTGDLYRLIIYPGEQRTRFIEMQSTGGLLYPATGSFHEMTGATTVQRIHRDSPSSRLPIDVTVPAKFEGKKPVSLLFFLSSEISQYSISIRLKSDRNRLLKRYTTYMVNKRHT